VSTEVVTVKPFERDGVCPHVAEQGAPVVAVHMMAFASNVADPSVRIGLCAQCTRVLVAAHNMLMQRICDEFGGAVLPANQPPPGGDGFKN
jgi:hypothetical protein